MSETLEEWHARATLAVQVDARVVASHIVQSHPAIALEERRQGIANIRKRNWWHIVPRLWHRKKVYAYFLKLRDPLWLGEDGIIYSEYADLFGNSYFMEAEIWRRDTEGLRKVMIVVRLLDPCVLTVDL